MSKKLTLEEMQKLAKKRSGVCLSKRYIDSRTKLLWKCKKKHIWPATPNDIQQGKWCPKCKFEKLSKLYIHSINDMRKMAKEKGGKCLSKEYLGNHKRLIWECQDGHIWETEPACIQSGRWCPECAKGKAERLCRAYFEQIFGMMFISTRFKWLKNSRGNQMHLDGFCKELSLGFEYHGEQHYQNLKYFKTNLAQRKKDDREKKRVCAKHRIKLIIIPYTLASDKYVEYINKFCNKHRIPFPKISKKFRINLKKASSPGFLKEMQKIAISRGGKCLSKYYLFATHHLLWKCHKGHKWYAMPHNIKNKGSWCPKCATITTHEEQRKTIEDMRALARKHGGKCLSTIYVNKNKKLLWQCKEDHRWWTRAGNIMQGSWCYPCRKKEASDKLRGTIEQMRQMAKKHNGKCLSTHYFNSQTNLLWQCKEGHKFTARPGNVKQGYWCPDCGGSKRLTIEEMQKIARDRGGTCLSSKYINIGTKLKWKCSKGHAWEAIPEAIKRGCWCPECWEIRRKKKLPVFKT